MASKEELLGKAQDAVEKGILTKDNYQMAINATRDNPELIDYFSSVFSETDQVTESTELPPQYNFEGTEVSKELFEELSQESDPNFIGDIIPGDESVPFQEEVEELVFAPTDKPVEELVFAPTDKPVEDLVFAPTDKPMTIGEQNVAALNNTVDLTDPSMLEFNDQAQKNEDTTWNLALTRFTPEQIEEMKDNPIGWSEANDFITPSDYLPLGGVVRGYEALGLAGIAKKIQDKVPLTESEETKFNDYIDMELEKQIRGFTWGGGMKYYGSPMPAFIVEFAATGGVGKTAQFAATQALTKGVMVTAQAAAVARYTGYGARVAAQSTAMVPANVANYGDLRLGQYVQLTQTGQAILSDAKESPAVTALKAFAYTNAEIASELVGAKIATHVLNPITRRLATNAKTSINKLPPALIEGITKAYQKIQPNAKVQDILTRAGWHGVLNELGEERVAALLNTYVDMAFGDTFTVDEVWDRIVPDKDQFLIEAGLIATMGGVKTVGVAASNILSNQGATEQEIMEALEGLTDEELQNVVDEQTNVEENAPVDVVLKADRVGDYALDQQKSEDQTMLEFMQISFVPREVISQKINEAKIQEYEATEELSFSKRKDKEVKRLKKAAEEIKKTSLRFIDLIARGGALDPEQLISYGADPATFYNIDQFGRYGANKKSPIGKKLKRVWSAPNPTQTISDLTERYNEELGLFDMGSRAGGSSDRTVGDNEMAEMVIEWLGEGNNDLLINQGAQMEIDMILDEADRLENMDDLEVKEYFDEAYRSIAQYNESEVPVETEASLAGEDIEYADSIDQAEFNENVAELEKFLIEQETAEKAEMYDIPEGELLDQFVDQPELVDDAPPMIDHSQSLFASFYAAFVNKFDAVEKALKLAKSRGAVVLDGANTELLISAYSGIIGNIKYTLQRNTYSMDVNGNMVKSGIGLKPILEAFDAKLFGVEPNKAKRKADLAKFLIAKRIQQDLQNYTIPGVRDEAPKVEAEVEIDSGLPDAPNLNEQYDEFIADGENVYDSSEQEIAEQKEGFDYGYTAAYGEEVEVGDLLGIDDSLSNVFEMGYYYGREAGKANNPKFGEYESSVVEETPQPELAGPTQPQPTVVQPDFAKDKKFIGPVTERRVSEEQALQAEIDLADLAFKYGDAIEFFDSTSQELYGFQKRVLQLFVKSGNMSQEQYNEIVNANQNYIPFQRVMLNDFLKNKGFNQDQVRKVLSVLSDDEIQQVIDDEMITQEQYDRIITDDPGAVEILKPLMQPSKGGKDLFSGASAKAVVKRLRGSDLAIKDPINSIIGNTSRIIDLSSRNNIAMSLVNLKDYLPEFIQEIPQQMQEVTVNGEKVLVPSNRPPADAIEVFINGKRKYFEVSAPMLKAFGCPYNCV
jgi:alkylhydroperoxidase/carboxymuconolactone decarboxylase family protein YurZ